MTQAISASTTESESNSKTSYEHLTVPLFSGAFAATVAWVRRKGFLSHAEPPSILICFSSNSLSLSIRALDIQPISSRLEFKLVVGSTRESLKQDWN